jgi:hypothetical protein
MSALSNSDFAQLLDELMRVEQEPSPGVRASIPFDFLMETIRAEVPSAHGAAADYFDALSALDEVSVTALDEVELPSIEPEAVADELRLCEATEARDLDQLRREFAFRNHPDRVGPELRDRAMIRMQIANRLIDEAKRRALAGARQRA